MSNKKLRKTVTSDLDKPEEEEKKSERDELFDNLGSGMGLLRERRKEERKQCLHYDPRRDLLHQYLR